MPYERFPVSHAKRATAFRAQPEQRACPSNPRTQRHIFSAHMCRLLGVSARKLRGHRRHARPVTLLQHIAMYLANTSLSLSFVQLGRVFGRDARTVAYGCRRVEDLRDCPSFDWKLSLMEEILRVELDRSGFRPKSRQ